MAENKTIEICSLETKIDYAFSEYYVLAGTQETSIRNDTLELMRYYINKFYQDSYVKKVDRYFFEQFYNIFLPLQHCRLYHLKIEAFAKEWFMFACYLKKNYDFKDSVQISKEAYVAYKNELGRILYILQDIRKYSEMPVRSYHPFIVDMICYKNIKTKNYLEPQYYVYDQGYYVINDTIGNYVILSKEKANSDFFKIKIDETLASEMKKGDIIYMSIKRKLFYTTWEIIHVKAYFNERASAYLRLGGSKSESRKDIRNI